MCISDFLQTVVNVLSVPSFGFVIWQVLRAEGMRAPRMLTVAIHRRDPIRVSDTGTPMRRFAVEVTPGSPDEAYDVHLWPASGNARMLLDMGQPYVPWLGFEEERRAMGEFVAPFEESVWVAVIWHSPSPIRRRSVAQSLRIRIAPIGPKEESLSPDIELEAWRWYRTAPIRNMLNRFLRNPLPLGSYRRQDLDHWWKSHIPVNDGTIA